ncbi:MAG: LytTR family DNA-binding domain-containing protein [Bacteroidales bacterium]|nr:LytTR family DNA-binding domain-containing protein [Bacteroidales bacterium]
MKLLIIEDEPASAQRLKKLAEEIDPEIIVLEILDSISSAVDWFHAHTEPDLILSDIHLADGLSFEIFKEITIFCPVIFTTAYDQYALQAFKVNSIDYLLKPIKKTELAEAIRKFRKIQLSSPKIDLALLTSMIGKSGKDYLKRLMIRIGQQIKVVEVKDIAYFYIEEKIVFAVSFTKDRHPMDLSLDQLEKQLDPERFFRINRAFIISLESIETMITYSKARIKIRLKPPCDLESITSTERSAEFRDWLRGRW